MNCPHCNKEINPASILGKESAKNRDTSSEAMRELVSNRWMQARRNKIAELMEAGKKTEAIAYLEALTSKLTEDQYFELEEEIAD